MAALPVLALVAAADTTPFQEALYAQVESAARLKADQAESQLLARLGMADVQQALRKCCPAVSAASPAELAERLRAEIAASEVISAFNARTPGKNHSVPFYFGPSLDEASNVTTFDNLWSVWLLEQQQLPPRATSSLDDLETSFYGLKPFAQRAEPSSAAETRERGVSSEPQSTCTRAHN